jgi:hypothetical protein
MEKEEESFNTLKEAFRKSEIRQYFNLEQPSTVNTDTSNGAIAGVL